ncbi:MAG: hypothetical protein JSW47_13815, partial [Phycisphaerales bacterium]
LEGVPSALDLEEPSYGKEILMDLCLHWKLKALPIWNPAVFSLRSAIATFITISERSVTDARALEAALGKLSDGELEEHSHPETVKSTSQAIAFLASKGAQSSQYNWKQHDNCLVLLSRSKFAESLPGVAFEFVIRTGRSSWTVYRIPDPGEILDFAMYLERNELIMYSQHPSKSPIRIRRQRLRYRLAKLAKAISLALLPLPVHKDPLCQRRGAEGATISGALPS